jgi:hypothetical protein
LNDNYTRRCSLLSNPRFASACKDGEYPYSDLVAGSSGKSLA